MEDKASIGPTMVSRLPKFGGRPSTSGTSPLCNGSTQPATPTQDRKTTSSGMRPNGLIHPSPFSLKWKKDEEMMSSSPTTPNSAGDSTGDKTQSQLLSLAKEIKNSSPATPKMRQSGSLMVAVSSPKAIPKQSKMSPRLGSKLGQSPLNGVSKMGLHGSNIPARTVSESRLVRPMLGSTSSRSSSQDSLSQSNESLKMMTIDNMVRSNSFTHFKQIPSPTSEPITRSFSFNRAVELAKPLVNTQLRPPRSSFLKPPQLSNGRVGLGLNGSLGSSSCTGLGLGGLKYSKTPAVASSLPSPSVPTAPGTPRALKKPLLPSSVLNKSLTSTVGSSGYRQVQSGQAKQQKSLFPDRVKHHVRSSAASEYEGLLGKAVNTEPTKEARKTSTYGESDESSGNAVGNGGESGDQTAGETLEDMSLSSASSLDRGDTSEEFLDDLDSVGDVLSDGDVLDNRKSENSTETPLHSFVNDTNDWKSANLAEHKEESPMQESQELLVLSPEQGDAPQASSVELSPANSSGGTYMWDEEGLEPLEGHVTHPLDSYDDSEFNSMDILNNLDLPGTGDLDDDDLMLDVDLPEDGFHDFNRMSHNERSERTSRQGQRRKHHRYSGPDHFYNNSRAHIFQHYDGLNASRISSGPVQSESRQHDCRPMLDELALEHMTQDCTLLKNQLLRLKTLLQLEETDFTVVSEETEDSTTASQLEILIKEVQMLKEELKSRDKIIAQLTSQCQQLQQQHQREQMSHQGRQVRCQSQQQRAPSSLRQSETQMDKRTQHHYDKATQTYWRPPNHAPQILQPFNPCLSEHPRQGRLVKTPPTEGPSKVTKGRSEETTRVTDDCPPEALVADVLGAEGSDKLSHLPSTNLHRLGSCAPQGITARDSPASAAQSAAQHGGRPPAVMLQNSITSGSAGSTCPRMLQPPCLRKRVSLHASKPGGTAGFASLRPGCSLGPAANQTKQLPPPSRGLPCFNTGAQLQTSLFQPLKTSEPKRDPWCTRLNYLEDPTQGTLKDLWSVKTVNPLSRSCLPKPKIP